VIMLEVKALTRRMTDSVGPITPGPGSKFEFVDRHEPRTAKQRLKGENEDNNGGSERVW